MAGTGVEWLSIPTIAMTIRKLLCFVGALSATAHAQFTPAPGSLFPAGWDVAAFTVSIPHPAARTFHVTLRCGGLAGEVQDLKMPAWMPGYYRLLDYANNVSNFRATDRGHVLPWEKVTRNTWRVVTSGASEIVVDYDVSAGASFVAQNFLDENRAYIAPPGLFLYVAGRLQRPVTVTLQAPDNWTTVATGLDPVPKRPHTFFATDFDVLYDSPILMGNQELRQFDVGGVPHEVAIENVPASVDRDRMLSDLKRMVETATRLVGEIPYRHYVFLLMGQGMGGIEHLNSAAIAFNGKSLGTPAGYSRWLSYVAHEYFHNFNVKRIRPLALGPFDYETENLTDMLWVSEGLTVYYEDLILVRAGLLSVAEYLKLIQNDIARFENEPGHRFQSAAESSLNTWGNSGIGNDRNNGISYYDNGALLGAILDLAIRNQSGNRQSLDDVMRALYRKYYKERSRGFTDAEFRRECETAAGGPLAEAFDYASTSKQMDYAKYLGYAGLSVTSSSQEAPGVLLDVNTRTADGDLTILESRNGGLLPGDRIVATDGVNTASAKKLNEVLAGKKPGETIEVDITRDGIPLHVVVVLAKNRKLSYTVAPVPNPSLLQAAILNDWLSPYR